MPRIKIEPHPYHPQWRCADCVHWHFRMKKYYVCPQPGQFLETKEAIKQGLPIDKMLSTISAPCIQSPAWQMNDENSYCDQFQPKVSN